MTFTNTPTMTYTPTITNTPTPTFTPQTFTITIEDGTLSGGYSGYYYSCPNGTNNTANGLFSMTVYVGDTINFPAASIHPLYFDNDGSGTCITGFAGETNASTPYTFTAAGTYYFQCGIHAQNCVQTSCSSTSCTALAGVLTVLP